LYRPIEALNSFGCALDWEAPLTALAPKLSAADLGELSTDFEPTRFGPAAELLLISIFVKPQRIPAVMAALPN
jgi:hypothetical protein